MSAKEAGNQIQFLVAKVVGRSTGIVVFRVVYGLPLTMGRSVSYF
jgi:hypothetical protein